MPDTNHLAGQTLPARISGLNESLILQVAARALARDNSIRLYAGESDQPTPRFIIEAANEAMLRGETRYVLSRGIQPLRDAIARYLRRTYHTDIQANRITVTVGGMQAISQSLLAIMEPGDQVIIPVPVWPNILEAVQAVGGQAVAVPMQFSTTAGWQLNMNHLVDAITPATRAIFINSPANPTGWVMGADDMRALLALCRDRGIWIISDEVYGRLVYPRADRNTTQAAIAPSLLSYIKAEDQVIVTNTMSKNWSMTGWRIGWVVAPPSMGLVYDNLMQYSSTGATTFAQHAAVAALDNGEQHIDSLIEQCRIGRDIVCDALAGVPDIRLAKPDGAFYLFFGLDGLTDSRQLAFDLLDATGVALEPGAAFHPRGEGWMRLCFGVSHPTLTQAADRITEFLSDRAKRQR
ncbi:MAG: pyridoxal phosphate-dependent aminotransferase [Burkholderiaceae bacterium]